MPRTCPSLHQRSIILNLESAMVVPITSAAGVIALLDEPEPELQSYALQKLNGLVDDFWAEVADSVSKIEVLFETASFPDRKLAALVASKVYFHLGEFDEALSFALGSAELFDVDKKDEYVDTVVSKAIDAYIEATSPESSTSGEASPDPRLRSIVDQMFSRCIADKDYKQALGIALETSRLDVIEEVFNVTRDQGLLAYVLEAVMGVVHALNLRNQVLHLLVKLFQSLPTPDNFSISQCYVYLNAPSLASELLSQLVEKAHNEGSSSTNTENDPLLVAYQIAFDLAESATQEFLENVRSELLTKSGGKIKEEGADATTAAQGEDVDMNEAEPSESSAEGSISRIRSILLGEESIQLYLDFLQRSNKADLPILKSTKDALDARSSVYHSAVSFANAFVNAGTTSDQFLRDNLEWLAKASNWSKFTATAALGVINKGNLKEGISILRPYLPQDGVTSSVYSEGGSLFALGLVHANHGQEVMELLKNSLKNNPAEIVQHGAALGLGAAGMATGNEEVYEELRNILYTDSAVAGEGAGYAMGLVMLGTGSEKAVEEMLQYAHDTAHEKIIRGLAMGLAMLFYGKEETADTMIDTLMSDKDAILRYGGVYTVALAYAGTGNNKAIRRLLHVAVSDVNDDVRRAAVTSLGFLLFRNPTQVPRIVQLLSESYNPHVRYGSTLALGIACAGTGLDEAIDLLEPMTKDPVDFVRQGACISLAMIFIQQNETLNPRVTSVRKTFEKIISDKHEDAMAKFGATLAQGLIDAGGRNVTISLSNRGGSSNMSAIVGMALFCQFWYWFPLAHFASLAFTPTALIGLNRDLNIPKFNFKSNVRPSIFSYPVANKPQVEKKAEKVQTAVLSTTAKAKARQIQKEKEQNNETSGEDAVMTDANATAPEKKEEEDSTMKVDEKPKTKKERKVEPSFEMLPNYSRVTPSQLKYVSFPPDSRFVPIRKVGIDSPNQSIKNQVYNSESVAGKLLGNSYLPQGASGTVTPAGNNGKSTPVSSQQTKSKSTETSTQASSVNATTASSEVRRSILNSNVGGGGGILLLIDRKASEPFVSFSSTDDDPSKSNADGNDEVHKAATSGIDGEGNGDKELTGVADSVAAGSNSGTNQGPPPPAA